MSDGITFYNKKDAEEYILKMGREGFNTSVSKPTHNIYVVTKTDRIPEGYKFGGRFYQFDDDDELTVLKDGINTRTKLHEHGHKYYKHKYTDNPEEALKAEIDADRWAYNKMERDVSVNSLLNIAYQIIIDYKIDGHTAFNIIVKNSKEKGFNLSNEDKQEMWNRLKNVKKGENV